jgi:hypothetical protein
MDYHTTRHHEAAVALFRESRVDAAGGSGAAFRVAELPRGETIDGSPSMTDGCCGRQRSRAWRAWRGRS